jgi:di/tricarboxylate transporter
LRHTSGKVRAAVAISFVIVMAVAIYAVPGSVAEHNETAWTVSLVVLYLIAGALIARWWAVALAFVPVVLVVPLGTHGDADGTPLWWWALIDTVVIFVWVMVVGVLVGLTARRTMHRRA